MNRLERSADLNEVLLKAFQTWQSEMWTALPGQIESYDPATQTCAVRPTVTLLRYFREDPPSGSVQGYDKVTRSAPVEIPPLEDVPVMFPSAGGYTLTFPVVKGDEVLVVFASRCIDAWWAYGGPQPQMDLRMHDLSDGFAILSPKNQKRLLNPAPAASSVQLRSDDGQAIIEIAGNHVINITCANANVTATNTATIKAASIVLKNAGSALKKLVNDTFLALFDAHTHTSGGAGSPTSAPLTSSTPSNATTVVQAE